ncbi:MAG: ribosome hibernation-promoting factor, HPF/YfiA family [Candidatus Zixiibacteriota bacterium]
MKIIITGRHLEMDEKMRSYAEKKLHKAETYFDRIIEAHMILSAEKHRRIAEVTLNAKRVTFHAEEETEDIYASIDGVMEKVDTQVRRYKEKLSDRKHRSKEVTSSVEEGSETGPRIIKVNKFAPKPMTTQEAVMQMMLLGDDFLVFSNSRTNQVNVVYMRKDGNYGWIEPED